MSKHTALTHSTLLLALALGAAGCGSDPATLESTPQEVDAQARVSHAYDRNGGDLAWGGASNGAQRAQAQAYSACDLDLTLYTPGTDDVVYTLTDTSIPWGLDPIRLPGIEFQGDFEASVILDCGDAYPFVSEDLLISTSGLPVFPDAARPTVSFTYGVVSELTFDVWQQDSFISPVEAGWSWYIQVDLTGEHAGLIEGMEDMSAKGTLSGCTSTGGPVSASMAYDDDLQALLWITEDADGDFLTVGPECEFYLEVKDEGAVRMDGETSFVATADAGNGVGQDIGEIDIRLHDAQLDVTINYEGVVVSWDLDIASVAPYIDSGSWDGDVRYTIGTFVDGEALSIELERVGTHLLGDMYPLEAGTYAFTLRIADDSSTLLEGSDQVELGTGDEPQFTLQYMLNLNAQTANLTNLYLRAILEGDTGYAEGINVNVIGYDFEGYESVNEDCITGAGNEAGDEVNDGNATCMVRVPFGHYCQITYSAPGYKTALAEVTVTELDAIKMDYIVLQPN